uniref:Uncharacterized protein n=1 Tax=Aotus nancymaae TaxID=37293 RepID=A0A2K5F5Y0_AOTNA
MVTMINRFLMMVKQKALPTQRQPTGAPAQALGNVAATGHKTQAEMSETLQGGLHDQRDGSSSNSFLGTGGETWRARRMMSKDERLAETFTTHNRSKDSRTPTAPQPQASRSEPHHVAPSCSPLVWASSLRQSAVASSLRSSRLRV